MVEMYPAFLLLFWLMCSGETATNLQSVCLLVHCHAALHRSDHGHLCHDSYLYHNRRYPFVSIPIAWILRLNCQRLAVEMRVEVIVIRVLSGPTRHCQRTLHNLLRGVVGCLLTNRCHLVNLHSDWFCSCHWCSRCYMTYSVKIRSVLEHCRNPSSRGGWSLFVRLR